METSWRRQSDGIANAFFRVAPPIHEFMSLGFTEGVVEQRIVSIMNTEIETLGSEESVAAAYERVKADFAALRPEELTQVTLDIPSAVATIIGVIPEVKALRERIEKELPAFDLAAFDKLEDYAWALSYAQTMFLMATQPPDDLPVLAADAAKLRERLLVDARSLSQYKLVDEGQLENLKGPIGYKNIAQDLQILAFALQGNWSKIQGKSPTTAADLETAHRLSSRLMRVVGLREQGPAQLAEATDRRLRAFAVTTSVYEETRQAIKYILRAREGEADVIIPSLHVGKGRRKQETDTDTTVPTPIGGTPAVPVTPTNPPSVSPAAIKPSSSVSANPFMTE